MTLGIRIDNCRYPAFGANGGLSGKPGKVIINPGGDEEERLNLLATERSFTEATLSE